MTTLLSLARRAARFAGLDVRRARLENPFATIRYLAGNKPIRTILDVGANEGQTALRLVKDFPSAAIHSIEPFDRAFERLRRNTGKYPQVTAHNVALGERDETREFFINAGDLTNSLLPNAPTIADYAPREWTTPLGVKTVQVRRLTSFCAELGLDCIDLLKIDSQGYELHILEGATTMLNPDRARFIFVELNFVPLYEGQAFFDEVCAFLRRFGYKLFALYETASDQSIGLKWSNGLFVPQTMPAV